jgi:hypothetical protein
MTDRYTCAGCLYFCEGSSSGTCCTEPGYPLDVHHQRIACRHYLQDPASPDDLASRLDDLASRLAVIEGIIPMRDPQLQGRQPATVVTAARRILTEPELADELAQLRARLDTLDRVVAHNGKAAQLLAVRVESLKTGGDRSGHFWTPVPQGGR